MNLLRTVSERSRLTPTAAHDFRQRIEQFANGLFDTPAASTTFSMGTFPSVIGAEDRREMVKRTDEFPWASICSLRILGQNGQLIHGTGWLVGPRTVITAGHCVFSAKELGGWAQAVHVVPGRQYEYMPYGESLQAGLRTVDAWRERADPQADIGCITLAEPLGETAGWLEAADLPEPAQDVRVSIAGYPTDKERAKVQFVHSGPITVIQRSRASYAVDTSQGQSGGPILLLPPQSAKACVIGTHTNGFNATTGIQPLNSGVLNTAAIKQTIAQWLILDKIAAPEFAE